MAHLDRLPAPFAEHWEWQYKGLCRKVDPEVFFPPDSERGPKRLRRELDAKRYCQSCPVLTQCREHALQMHEPYGIWGGMTARERELFLRQRPVPQAALSGRSPQKTRRTAAEARRAVRR
jgi:WhiB family redox-sensing transcriptional regulator